MGLLDAFRTLFSSDAPRSDGNKDPRVLLVASMEIVGAYAAVVEKYSGYATLSLKLPETLLPYPKQTIAQAITNVRHAIGNPSLRLMVEQVMEPDAARRVLSPDFHKFLSEGLVILSSFVPPSEFESDRKRWEDLLPVLETLGSDVRARYEHLFKGPQALVEKKSDR